MRGARFFAVAGLLAIAACTDYAGDVPLAPAATPPAPERPVFVAPPEPVGLTLSPDSAALATYYQRLQNDLLSQGLLRGDGGGPDTPFTDTMLARNFIRIGLFDEYVDDGGVIKSQATLSRLRRWDKPVRMTVAFGPSSDADRRRTDRANVREYAARLSRLTGVPIIQTDADPNYHVFFVNEDERRALGTRLRQIVPNIADSSLRAIVDLPRDQLCIVVAFASGDSAAYDTAIAVIRVEHPDFMRLTCIHEELAQGMGLANDSPNARPSIFNDDEEFGLLTTQDELMLRMLYDPRLTIGMSAAEAAPIARMIATDYLAGNT